MEASPAAAPLFPALLEQGLAQPSFLKSVSRQEGHKMPQSQGTWAGTAVAEETVPEHPWVPELAWDQDQVTKAQPTLRGPAPATDS